MYICYKQSILTTMTFYICTQILCNFPYTSHEMFITFMNELSRLHYEIGQDQFKVDNYEQFNVLCTIFSSFHLHLIGFLLLYNYIMPL